MTSDQLPILVIVWVVCGIASLLIAQSKGAANPGGWFVTGLLLGPLGVLLTLMNARPDPEA